EYVHRSGRTARAGAAGSVVTLALPHQTRQARRILGEAEVEPRWAEDDEDAEHPVLEGLGGRTPAGEPAEGPDQAKYKGAPRKLELARARGAAERRAGARRTNEGGRASWEKEPPQERRGGPRRGGAPGRGKGAGAGRGGAQGARGGGRGAG